MRSRVNTVEFLVQYDLTDMIDHHAQNWPTLDVPKAKLCQLVMLFKRLSFSLLFKLADCTAGLKETLKIRAKQAEFLESLTTAELASLGVIVEVMGQNYFTMTKNALDKSVSADDRVCHIFLPEAPSNLDRESLRLLQSFVRLRFFIPHEVLRGMRNARGLTADFHSHRVQRL